MLSMTFQQQLLAVAKLNAACDTIGGVQKTADLLGITRTTIHNWRKSALIPAESAVKLEIITDGAVKRWEFRPDLFIQPEETDED